MKHILFTIGIFSLICTPALQSLQKDTLVWWQLSKRNRHMVISLTKDTVQTSTKPVIIEAFATWCPHCTKMKPIFEQLEKELGQKYIFAAFDIDESPELTKQFNIKSLPTFIFIKNKNEVSRELGEKSPENLKKLIVKYLG